MDEPERVRTQVRSHIRGLMVRDARLCRAPHHEGLVQDLILRSGVSHVSKDDATEPIYAASGTVQAS